MEEILLKTMFDDKDLNKLSPDYRPISLFLRMQMRRTLIKDSHSHNEHKCDNWPRKSIKKTKDSYSKINKDIVKLRENFQNINLKNKIMLKQVAKKSNIKHCDNISSRDDYKREIESDLDIVFDYTNNESDLIVQNDKEFKVNPKPESHKLNVEVQNNKHFKEVVSSDYVSPSLNEYIHTNVLRIECTTLDNNSPDTDRSKRSNKEIKDKVTESKPCDKDLEPTVTDLQKLLIMMAVSSRPNNINEENYGITSPNCTSHVKPEILERNQENVTITSNSYKSEEFKNILNISSMKLKISDSQKRFIKKYTEKWKFYVKKRKEFISQQRRNTLNTFFERLEKKKKSDSQIMDFNNRARDYSTYQHRYKVQRHIIALQKAKLEEQTRLIEELKYNKIIEASKQSVDEMREEVRRTYYEIDRQLKPKIKCLTNELKIPEIEETSLVLQCLKVPQFLQRMEKRAREREEKHAMIRERRKQMEEERIKLKLQAEIEKTEMDREEKAKRMKELRNKRKKEKVENIRRKQYAERIRALTVMADLHNEKRLMLQYGIRPLRKLIEIKRDNMENAKSHYTFQLKKNVFLHFMWHTEDMWFERNYKADDFYRKKVLKKTFEGLKQNHYEYILKRQVAEDYYDLYLTQLAFRKLRVAIELLKKEHEIKWQKAIVYCNSNLLFKTFTCWRTLPALNALKRQQDARKARWREKVLQVVPDYMPPDD